MDISFCLHFLKFFPRCASEFGPRNSVPWGNYYASFSEKDKRLRDELKIVFLRRW